jgi:hypothetical protein
MKIRIKREHQGQFNAYAAGEEIELPEAAARKLIDRGIAEVVMPETDARQSDQTAGAGHVG